MQPPATNNLLMGSGDLTVRSMTASTVTLDSANDLVHITDATDGSIKKVTAASLIGGGAVATWTELSNSWTAEPVEVAYSGGDGTVLQYTYGSTLYYRFVPDTYDSTEDKFYDTYSNPTLSDLIATRGVAI